MKTNRGKINMKRTGRMILISALCSVLIPQIALADSSWIWLTVGVSTGSGPTDCQYQKREHLNRMFLF